MKYVSVLADSMDTLSVEVLKLLQLNVGVIGFSVQDFNKFNCKMFLTKTLSDIKNSVAPDVKIAVVSGYTDMGVPAIAYRVAQKLGMKTIGFAPKEAVSGKFPLFKVKEKIIVGNKFGDESRAFIKFINILIKYGGGKQSKREYEMFFSLHHGKDVFVYQGRT